MAKKVTVLKKYLDYADIFIKDLATKSHKHLGINKYAIDLDLVAWSNFSNLLLELLSYLSENLIAVSACV